MKVGAPGSFGTHLKALRVAAGFTQEELATIAGLSVHAVSALERGERKRPHVDTVRALAAALDLDESARDALVKTARVPADEGAVDELSGGSLPLALTRLLGRDADVQALRQWFRTRSVRLMTLVGPGGVGKTRLALEIARGIAEDGATRVAFVELATIRDPAFVAPAIAEALGLSNATALDLPRRVRAASDERRPTLLVLDNCEHVLDAAPLVVDLLTSAPSLRLLATSRAPLRVRGEKLHAVGPLELQANPDLHSPADLARNPAVRLFVERVRDVQPDFRLTAANSATVTAICRRLDALPLALELAAPWIKVLTAEELLRRLGRDVLLPSVAPRDLPERQQTLSTTVAWSYHLLCPDEQRAFRRFAALPGRFPIEAAAAVLAGGSGFPTTSDEALAAAAALVEKSLLHRVETSISARPLYQMLETVRAYAGQELASAGERDEALEGLARYCISEAYGASSGLIGPVQIAWLDRVRDDLHNHRGALAWLIERRRAVEASGIAWGLLYFWLIRGRSAEGLQWYQLICSLPELPPGAECRALMGTAVMSYTRGDLERTRDALMRALEIARGSDDTAITVHGENLLGHIELAGGNVQAARDLFAQSVEGFRKQGIPWGVGNALVGMAGVALASGDSDHASRLLDEATSVLREAGPWFQNHPLYIHAIEAVRRGDADRAIALAHESLMRSRQVKDRFAFVYALIPLAAAAALKGDHAWTARILGARDAFTERMGATVASHSVRGLRERVEAEARARLGADRWTRAYTAGRTASLDSLLKNT
jgi:predicted ATPase/DNA-binding XRE family transcriptional regulator